MRRIITLKEFTPAEAEQFTGVSRDSQRDWRRRKLVKKRGEGLTRFNVFELGELFALRILSERGVALDEAARVAEMCGKAIGYASLQWVNAYEGDHHRTEEAYGIREDERVARILAQDERLGRSITAEREAKARWGDKAIWLSRRVYRQQFLTNAMPSFLLIWWANGEYAFSSSFDDYHNNFRFEDERLSGLIFLLDLLNLGCLLLKKIGGPVVHVEYPDLPQKEGGVQ